MPANATAMRAASIFLAGASSAGLLAAGFTAPSALRSDRIQEVASTWASRPSPPEAAASAAARQLAAGALAACAAGALAARRPPRRAQRSRRAAVACKAGLEIGQDLAVPDDAFVVLGLAHCFVTVEGKLRDHYVLEPIAASTVEVIENGAATSYEAFIGTDVKTVLSQDQSALPAELLCGQEAAWADDLHFRVGCAARTWMRDHAREVVMAMAPKGEVRTGFNTSVEHKRILNFVNEVKDSDNIKQDMSIDAYGRDKEKKDGEKKEEVEAEVADLYDA